MQRRIVEPADVSGGALAELKSWLGITRPNEDVLLTDLLQSALSMCESFTGQTPLSQLIEERLPVQAGQHMLTSRPVSSVLSVELMSQSGERTELSVSQFHSDIQTKGNLIIHLP
ncbi:MAG: head-tail connector protein, partial [Pseudomonadota bacterium]